MKSLFISPIVTHDVEDYWPRRLIHIPTLTSYERSTDGSYNSAHHPKFSILSYTWGRWYIRGLQNDLKAPHLPICGTTWKIPSVKESHFTVENFHNVLKAMLCPKEGIEWAWIDIGCIDQDNVVVKMDEVGRQASIFKQASKAFAWLSHLHAQELSQHYHILENIGPQLDDGPDGQNEERCRVIYRSTVHILSDPWFTSLWTLQELFMRSDALILSNEGVPVPTTSNHPLHLEMIANFYQNLMSGLRFRADPEDLTNAKTTKATVSIPQMISHHRAIKELVNRSGLLHSFDSSPNAQYGCAKFRCTEYPEDRVYAIMQIYNIRVGQSVRPSDRPSVSELAEEFGLAINARSMLLGQTFTHTGSGAKSGISWCITENSEIPNKYLSHMCTTSKLYKDPLSGLVMALGRCCVFKDFFANFVATLRDDFRMVDFHLDQPFRDTVDPSDSLLRVRGHGYRPHPDSGWQKYGERIIERCSGDEDLLLMILGNTGDTGDTAVEDTSYLGLLLRKECSSKWPQIYDGKKEDTDTYQRIGLCFWTTSRSSDRLLDDHGSLPEIPRLSSHFHNRFYEIGSGPWEASRSNASQDCVESIPQLFTPIGRVALV